MDILLPLLVILLGIFIHSLIGFGAGMIPMAFLPGLIGVRTAAPLVVLFCCVLEIILLTRYRAAFDRAEVGRLVLAAIAGVPLGVWALRGVNETALMMCLGAVISGYAVYALLDLRLPRLAHPAWGYLLGFTAGLLNGAYSVAAPPMVIYADCRRWGPEAYKSNLQAFFLVNDIFTILTHALLGNLTRPVLNLFGWSLPVMAVALAAGTLLSRRIHPQVFRKLTLIMLAVMGIRMLLFP